MYTEHVEKLERDIKNYNVLSVWQTVWGIDTVLLLVVLKRIVFFAFT